MFLSIGFFNSIDRSGQNVIYFRVDRPERRRTPDMATQTSKTEERAKPTFMGKIPQAVWAYFALHGVEQKDVLLAMRSDLSPDGTYLDAFILLTKDSLLVAEGALTFTREQDSRKRVECYDAPAPRRFDLPRVVDPKVELMLSTGRAVCKLEGEDYPLFGFSSTYKHDASVFCRAVTELQENGYISARLLKEESEEYKICPKCGRRFPDQGRRYCPACLETAGLAFRLGKMFLKYKWFMLMILLTLGLNVALALITPYISNSVLYGDVLTEGGKLFGKIGALVLVLAAVRLLSLLVNLVTGVINTKVAAEVTCDLKKDIFSSLGRLSLSFFTNRQTGSLMTQINSDSTTIYWFFCDGFPSLCSQVIQLLVLLVVMFTLNVELTLYTFITIPLFFVSFRVIGRLFEKLYARAWSRRASYNSLISDVINGIRVVKAFSREEAEKDRFAARSNAAADADRELEYTSSRIYPFLQFALKIGSYVVWIVGGFRVMGGDMPFETLMTFSAYFALVYAPIEMLSDITNWWSDCLNALKRLFDIKDAKVEVEEAAEPKDPEIKGALSFQNVSFSYVENRKVIKNVSFDVPAGKTLGIVGQTGAGKSTLANLITRLYDPDEGMVTIDGNDVKELSFACLRKNIAIVSQETYLFNGSIIDNIRYARPDATYEEVLAASKAAHAHDFIIKFPDGYNTLIGLGARQLSGGERQRVSIARALLKDPKILILDEATSAMDTQTERDIQHALTALSRSRTTVMIAHRLSTLRDADSLIAIEDGKLMESGTASELMEQKGVYYKLYTLQAEALKNVGIGEE